MVTPPTLYKTSVTVGLITLNMTNRNTNMTMDNWQGPGDLPQPGPAYEISYTGWRITISQWPLAAGQSAVTNAVLSAYQAPPPPTSGTVIFHVTDQQYGTALSGASVLLGTTSGTTGSDGRATFVNVTFSINYNVTVTKSGYDTKGPWQFTPTTNNQVVEVQLVPGAAPPPPAPTTGSFTVHVTDQATGSGLPNAKVDVAGDVKYTDASGNAAYSSKLLNANYLIIVSATGYTDNTPTHYFTTSGQVFNVPLTKSAVPAPAKISGYVKDYDTKSGIALATVDWQTQRATTDISGYYVIDNPDLFSGTIKASAPGYASQETGITAPSTGTLAVNFELKKSLGGDTKISEIPDIRYDTLDYSSKAIAGVTSQLVPGLTAEGVKFKKIMGDMAASLSSDVRNEISVINTTHSPISPADAEQHVEHLATVATGSYVAAAAASIAAEVLMAGQLETPTLWLREFLDKYGLDTIASLPTVTWYENALKIPYEYLLKAKFTPMIPGISDQIRFAVREAYPGVAFEKVSAEMKKWIAYLGYSDTWSDTFWNAHWIIPSVSQLFEMRWRDLITDDELTHMLKVNDIHPNWIDKVKQITFEPARLVDIRNAFEFGAITESTMRRQLLNRGYNPADIDWIVATSKNTVLRDDMNRIRTQLVNNYVEGFLTDSQLAAELRTLGFGTETANMNLKEAQVKQTLDMKKTFADAYLDRFEKLYITEAECVSALTSIGMVSGMITNYVNLRKLKWKPSKGVM